MEIGSLSTVLSRRADFLGLLKNEYEQSKADVEAARAQLHVYEGTSRAVEEIGKKVEHESLLKLSGRLYASGMLTHTGEYTVDLALNSDSYKALFTLSQTLQYLQNKILAQMQLVELMDENRKQLEERLRIMEGDENEIAINEDMPPEIRSEKGVAFRVGEFYEIFEYEE